MMKSITNEENMIKLGDFSEVSSSFNNLQEEKTLAPAPPRLTDTIEGKAIVWTIRAIFLLCLAALVFKWVLCTSSLTEFHKHVLWADCMPDNKYSRRGDNPVRCRDAETFVNIYWWPQRFAKVVWEDALDVFSWVATLTGMLSLALIGVVGVVLLVAHQKLTTNAAIYLSSCSLPRIGNFVTKRHSTHCKV